VSAASVTALDPSSIERRLALHRLDASDPTEGRDDQRLGRRERVDERGDSPGRVFGASPRGA
jgi:hypothetical protein